MAEQTSDIAAPCKPEPLSLLFPDEASRAAHANGSALPSISEEVCEELGLCDILSLKNASLADFFTADPAVLRYRQQTLADMLEIPELSEVLGQALPILFDIRELRQIADDRRDGGDAYLFSMTEIELYVSCVDTLAQGLAPLACRVSSPAFLRLCEVIRTLTESDYYKDLNERLRALSARIREVKSVTVGVNLDAQLRPVEAGVVSVNAEPFKSGKLLDRILRMSFRNDSFTCIARLSPFGEASGASENRREALSGAFYAALDDVFRSSVRAWRGIVGEYVLENADFLLRILPEIEFLNRSVSLLRALRDRGYSLCNPVLRPTADKAFAAQGLYNPEVALRIDDRVVDNDFCFDDNARIYILSGPNRGGKSVITCAVGLAQAMAQLGLPVPATAAEISPVDAIFTHFPEGADDTMGKGRLGEECARLRGIFDELTEDSLVLLDESLSSTGAYEASFIAAELLAAFAVKRCRGIFSTHLHELAASADEINARTAPLGGVRIDTLVAGMEEGRRSFRILRCKPDGKSYARDIANKYGLSFTELIRAESAERNPS